MTEKLAILGGQPVIRENFPAYNTLGDEEKSAVLSVLESGSLSGFYGSWSEKFLGGDRVREFELAWSGYFKVRHSISMNSATSGLIAAIGAIGVEPGDEVIVSPWTMCATATAILVWGGIPIFADISPDTFNLDPNSIADRITPRTRAIVVPDIFGHPADLDAIMAIARKHNLKVVEDAAQSPGAMYGTSLAGTIADIGVFSLNYHKHIHTGEGGMCVTNSPELASRMQLIRNHAEAVVGPKGQSDIVNMVGFNFRMGEIEAAIGIAQLRKLDGFIGSRISAATRLSKRLGALRGLKTPHVGEKCSHVYYIYPLVFDTSLLKVSRERIVKALAAEGVPSLMNGYANIHLNPIFQKKIAFGSKGYPWSLSEEGKRVSYEKGICPTAERMHREEMIGVQLCAHAYTDREVDLIALAFEKVWARLEDLRE